MNFCEIQKEFEFNKSEILEILELHPEMKKRINNKKLYYYYSNILATRFDIEKQVRLLKERDTSKRTQCDTCQKKMASKFIEHSKFVADTHLKETLQTYLNGYFDILHKCDKSHQDEICEQLRVKQKILCENSEKHVEMKNIFIYGEPNIHDEMKESAKKDGIETNLINYILTVMNSPLLPEAQKTPCVLLKPETDKIYLPFLDDIKTKEFVLIKPCSTTRKTTDRFG